MTNEQFLQQFGHFIDAPNGIQKLREMVLQLAVQGKLVEQDPNDVPASELLKQIQAEKAKLVADGKIKKGKSRPEIAEDEKPLVLPMGWSWSRLGAVGNIFNGNSINAREKESKYAGASGLPYIATKDVGYGRNELDYENGIRIPLTEEKFKIARKGSVLICAEGGSAGKKCGVTNQDICFGNKLFANEPYGKIPSSYLLYLYLSPLFKTLFADCMTGIIGGVSIAKFIELPIPLPPLAEQHRIVAKVEELMALCDQLEAERNARQATHQRLIRAVHHPLTEAAGTKPTPGIEQMAAWHRIRDNFADLYTTLESVQALRQTILQLAVQGKLVEQDPNDEVASSLIDRMSSSRDEWLNNCKNDNKECGTMLRKLGKLKAPKAPFAIPASWECIHLIQASRMLVDCHNKTAPYVANGIPIIRTSNIRDRKFRMVDVKYVNQDTYDYWSRRCPPEAGDIIFTREAPMGEAAIIPEGETYCLGQRTMLIRPMSEFVYSSYLLLALTEPHLLERASEHAIGSTVKHLRVGDVENLNIPIPPLAEQLRIVAKVDQLMTLCDQLETNIRDKSDTATRYAEAIVQLIAAV
jgi:type I restriction enzyme S subunit